MGRAKLNMELIKKEKDRRITFHTRKNNLMKKAHELATLCGIKAMVIVYGPKLVTQEAYSLKLEIFPGDRDEVLELIDKYKGQSSEHRKKRTSLLPSFFQERNRKAKQELAKLRKSNVQSKYPIWDSRYDNYTENDLRRVAALLEKNIENANARLGQIQADNNRSNTLYHAYLQQQMMLSNDRSMDLEMGNQNGSYSFTVDPHQAGFMQVFIPMPMPIQQQNFTFMDHYQDQRMVRVGHDYTGGASNNVYNAHPSTALYNYQAMTETADSITYANNLLREPPINYNRGMQSIAQHHMEHYHHMRPGSAHQMGATSNQVDAHAQFDENRKE